MSPAIDVEASVEEGLRLPISASDAEAAVRHVLSSERVESAEISVAFLGDDGIASLNQEYLGHDGPTDVISFALHSTGEPPLGDVYVGVDQAARQAAELGVRIEEELLRLTVHGTLHVLGYDHPAGAERDRSTMYLLQEELLASFLDRIRAAGR